MMGVVDCMIVFARDKVMYTKRQRVFRYLGKKPKVFPARNWTQTCWEEQAVIPCRSRSERCFAVSSKTLIVGARTHSDQMTYRTGRRMYCCRLSSTSGWLCRNGAKTSAWCLRYSVNDSLDHCPIVLTTSKGTPFSR